MIGILIHVKSFPTLLCSTNFAGLIFVVVNASPFRANCNVKYQKWRVGTKMFDKLVSGSNVKTAIRIATEQDSGQSLPLDVKSVKDHLLDKHPPGVPLSVSAISNSPPPTERHLIIIDYNTVYSSRSIIQEMDDSSGPSALDSTAWNQVCFSFYRASMDLCNSAWAPVAKTNSSLRDPRESCWAASTDQAGAYAHRHVCSSWEKCEQPWNYP